MWGRKDWKPDGWARQNNGSSTHVHILGLADALLYVVKVKDVIKLRIL